LIGFMLMFGGKNHIKIIVRPSNNCEFHFYPPYLFQTIDHTSLARTLLSL